jgi:F0F1-type ATP synthase epsilon subunit
MRARGRPDGGGRENLSEAGGFLAFSEKSASICTQAGERKKACARTKERRAEEKGMEAWTNSVDANEEEANGNKDRERRLWLRGGAGASCSHVSVRVHCG